MDGPSTEARVARALGAGASDGRVGSARVRAESLGRPPPNSEPSPSSACSHWQPLLQRGQHGSMLRVFLFGPSLLLPSEGPLALISGGCRASSLPCLWRGLLSVSGRLLRDLFPFRCGLSLVDRSTFPIVARDIYSPIKSVKIKQKVA